MHPGCIQIEDFGWIQIVQMHLCYKQKVFNEAKGNAAGRGECSLKFGMTIYHMCLTIPLAKPSWHFVIRCVGSTYIPAMPWPGPISVISEKVDNQHFRQLCITTQTNNPLGTSKWVHSNISGCEITSIFSIQGKPKTCSYSFAICQLPFAICNTP